MKSMLSTDASIFLLMGLKRNEKKIQRILKAIEKRKYISDILDDLVQIWFSQEGCQKRLSEHFLNTDTNNSQEITDELNEDEVIIDQLFLIEKSLNSSITYIDTTLANTDETEPLSQEAVDHFWECLFLFAHAINDTNSDIIRFVEENTDG